MDELPITDTLSIPLAEIDMQAVRSQGAGGQNVNKLSTAIHLRFDVRNSPSLPSGVRARLLASGDRRISNDGILILKSQDSRSQERNRQAALRRLAGVIRAATVQRTPRIPTRPGKATRDKQLDAKSRRGNLKRLRGKPENE
ncbi:MAG: aminoacyl-tRNA hydrolase [Gammaproteobacteria bacterium]|nr:aminoacyl-tRNA hydrolase [Gammaproteobacteria bacterium]MBT8104926.1 aminoacyl-tRNA hydrolase [Gammaproteobacteria bacterium]NNK24940.1 aminoacyl-tRNA hydrolase [Woeseiaceae bacterium]NNL63049.1 aminoacyl-tRNA hydrolase [Woeseiaceae bacterium]